MSDPVQVAAHKWDAMAAKVAGWLKDANVLVIVGTVQHAVGFVPRQPDYARNYDDFHLAKTHLLYLPGDDLRYVRALYKIMIAGDDAEDFLDPIDVTAVLLNASVPELLEALVMVVEGRRSVGVQLVVGTEPKPMSVAEMVEALPEGKVDYSLPDVIAKALEPLKAKTLGEHLDAAMAKGGRGECPYCHEMHNNVSFHSANVCLKRPGAPQY